MMLRFAVQNYDKKVTKAIFRVYCSDFSIVWHSLCRKIQCIEAFFAPFWKTVSLFFIALQIAECSKLARSVVKCNDK